MRESIAAHPRKWLCVLAPDGSTVRLWQLLRYDGTYASHPMECTFAYVKDNSGESVMVAGKHYDPDPHRSYSGFMYRKRLEAESGRSNPKSAKADRLTPRANCVGSAIGRSAGVVPFKIASTYLAAP